MCPLLLEPPSHLLLFPTPVGCYRGQFEFPESYSKFPLAICFTYGIVSFHVTLFICAITLLLYTISQQQQKCLEVPSSCIICPLLLLGWQGKPPQDLDVQERRKFSDAHPPRAARSSRLPPWRMFCSTMGPAFPSADAGLKWQHLCQGT